MIPEKYKIFYMVFLYGKGKLLAVKNTYYLSDKLSSYCLDRQGPNDSFLLKYGIFK